MPSIDIEDTIAAIASPPGVSQRGIVRISGPRTVEFIDRLFRSDNGDAISTTKTTDSISGTFQIADAQAEAGSVSVPGELLLWPTRQSYTRQPTAEFHTVGSTPVLQMVLNSVCGTGARLAKPGEFTLRAFLSGRIDLTQAEAVLAVIDSDGQQQLDIALQQLAGGLAGPLGEIRGHLMSTLAELEAGLDFVEEDIEFISQQELTAQLTDANDQLIKIVDQISSRDIAIEAIKVVLHGMPNSGKSSLFNAITQSEQAIVTNVPGTTTDFISATLEINSTSVELIDTAGFETTNEQYSSRVLEQAQTHRDQQQDLAQISLLCIDRSRPMTQWEIEQLEQSTSSTIVVLTKCDLPAVSDFQAEHWSKKSNLKSVQTSSVDRDAADSNGLGRLKELILKTATNSQCDKSVVSSTISRATESLRESQIAVQHALDAARSQAGEEIVAAEIRQSLEGLGHVVGTVYTDDILDLVFGRFCIGK
ncbi:MAG: tRNA modification GTPase [Mariniblastus sp.]